MNEPETRHVNLLDCRIDHVVHKVVEKWGHAEVLEQLIADLAWKGRYAPMNDQYGIEMAVSHMRVALSRLRKVVEMKGNQS